MSSLRLAASRIPLSRAVVVGQASATTTSTCQQQCRRALSSEGAAAVTKFHCAFAQYRDQNYAQTIESRFKKDIVCAAAGNSTKVPDSVPIDGMLRVISNIGMEAQLSKKDVKILFSELGNGREIPVDGLTRIL